MFRPVRRLGIVGLVATLMIGLLPAPTMAAGGYGVTITPSTVAPGSDTTLIVRVTNISGDPIKWIQIGRPNADYTVTSVNASGWSVSASDDAAVLTGKSIAPDGRANIQVNIHAVAWTSAAADWTVRAAGNVDGIDPSDCDGPHATSISVDMPPENEGVGVSGMNVVPGQSNAIVSWHSDNMTGSWVQYGPTSDYGSSSTYEPALTNDHQVAVSGLSPGSGYHFKVSGIDANGQAYFSGDGTFLTLDQPSGGSGDDTTSDGTAGGGTTSPGVTTGSGGAKLPTPRGALAIKAVPTEAVAPVVGVSTSVAKPFAKLPVLSGTVTDNVAVARVDYSLDGGKTWILVSSPEGLGTKLVHYTIAPSRLEDGNYILVVRGIDTSGNVGQTAPATLVVDLELPRIGSELVVYGTQSAVLDSNGRYEAAVGTDQTVTLNAVGGPTSIVVTAVRDGVAKGGQTFYLRQDRESGLWGGVLGFAKAGIYHLKAIARDGAGNQTSRDLHDALVKEPARVVDTAGQPVGGATITLYQRNGATGKWVTWDAEAYGQVNPQHSRIGGVFGALVPAGAYYLKVEAQGYKTIITRTFTLDRVTPLVPTLKLAAQQRWHLGKWSWMIPGITLTRTDVAPTVEADQKTLTAVAALVGHNLPRFSLPRTDGRTVTGVGLQGHPAVLTVLSTWSPVTSGQLSALAGVAAKAPAATVVPVYVGEHLGRVQVTLAQAGYNVPAVVDEHAILGDDLGVMTVPTHIFVDQTGKVKAVYTGVLSTDEIVARLAQLKN